MIRVVLVVTIRRKEKDRCTCTLGRKPTVTERRETKMVAKMMKKFWELETELLPAWLDFIR